MSNEINSESEPGQPLVYQIRIKGHLGRQWTDWFGGLTITQEDNGETLLTGPVVDQAALHGLLRKVRDLGVPLLSVNRVEHGKAEAPDVNETHYYRSKKGGDTHMKASVLAKPDNLGGTRMKAIVYSHYGPPDVLKLEEVEKPVPQDDEVLIKVHAMSVNAGDCFLLRGKARMMGFGLLKPKSTILGSDIAGRVEAVGSTVTQFQSGDEVFVNTATYGFGGFAEYVSVPETAVVLKPTTLSFEQAAAVPQAALTALQGLRDKGHIQPGQKVLINGASGGVGTFAVQLAKAFGAEVTAVCSTRNVDIMHSIGADHVIDYTQADFTKNGQRYDLILAVNGYHSIAAYKRALRPEGVYFMTGGSMAQLFQAMLLGPVISRTGRQKMGNSTHKPNAKDLIVMKELIEAGKVTPVIDRCYPLGETAEAIRYLEAGHARGKVVITVENDH